VRGRHRCATSEGRPVALLEWGPPARGADRRLVLVHGLGSAALEWELVAGPLAARLDAAVTAIDLPGYGRSRLASGAATMKAYERAVVTLLERDGAAIVVGHSMGGAVATRVAAHRPDLVRALVLLDPAIPGTARSLRARLHVIREFWPLLIPPLGRRVMHRRHRRRGADGIAADHLEWNVHRLERVDPQIRADLLAMTRQRWAHQREVDAVYADSARSVSFYMLRPMTRDLDAINCPTLLVHAEHDRLVPIGDARAAAARHVKWAFRVLDDCGHAPQVEMPVQLLDLVVPWIAGHIEAAAPTPARM
jgi:pimeloyl-ACP methyl ester carboxylesterase